MSDMVAPDLTHTPTPCDIKTSDADAFSLVSAHTELSTAHHSHPDQHWDGRRETLGSWFRELETVLSALSPQLYMFAVENYVSEHNKVVIFHRGQAAQLDGVLPRADYTWDHVAPADAASYAVDHAVVTATYERLYQERRLRDPTLVAEPPTVPSTAPYPVDDKHYVLSSERKSNKRSPKELSKAKLGAGSGTFCGTCEEQIDITTGERV